MIEERKETRPPITTLTDADQAKLEDPKGKRVDMSDHRSGSGVDLETIKTKKKKKKEGIIEEEESRWSYEKKRAATNLAKGTVKILGFGGLVYLLSGLWAREPISQKFLINDKTLGFVWLLHPKDSEFKGGEQILNTLEGSVRSGVNYNDRETWGLREGIGEKVFGKGGNTFGAKANSLVGWTEALLMPEGRKDLEDKANETGRGIEGIKHFAAQVGNKDLSWDEALLILRDPYFQFQEPYLNILTELRKEYLTGNGNLGGAIEAAKNISQAKELLQETGMRSVVDFETTMAIARTIPEDCTVTELQTATREIFLPSYRSLQTEGIEGIPLTLALVLGICANQSPKIKDWAKEQLKGLRVKTSQAREK